MRLFFSGPPLTWRLSAAPALQVPSTVTSPLTASTLRRCHEKTEMLLQTACSPSFRDRSGRPEFDVRRYFPRNPLDIVPKIAPLIRAVSATLLDDEPNSVTTSCLCCANVGRRRSPMAAFEQLETSASIQPSASR